MLSVPEDRTLPILRKAVQKCRGCDCNATQAVFGEYAAGFVLLDYFLPAVPGVVLESSGADGLMWPNRFSGVPDWTFEGPGPAVAGLSPFEPEG